MYLQEPPRGDGASSSVNFPFLLSRKHSFGICTHTYTVERASVTLARTHDCRYVFPTQSFIDIDMEERQEV